VKRTWSRIFLDLSSNLSRAAIALLLLEHA
jgi:hypothetical protein